MRAVIIEDDAEITEFASIAIGVGWPNATVVCVDHGSSAAQLIADHNPDVVILDLGLPDISGFDVLKQIRGFSEVPVVIVSVRDDEPSVVKGLEWGADEYVVKPFGQLELLARVRAVLRARQRPPAADMPILCGPLRLETASGRLSCGENATQLTRTESIILQCLFTKPGGVVAYEELAEALWGEYHAHSGDTLRAYVRRLRLKTDAITPPGIVIRPEPRRGYCLDLNA